jgi:hypothetical protein
MSTATQLKLIGLRKASAAHRESLMAAQWLAQLIGIQQEIVTIEDVYAAGISPKALGNAASAVFDESWQMCGFVKTTRLEARGRWIMQWSLRDGRR